MLWKEKTTEAIHRLLYFATAHHLIPQEDFYFYRNFLLDCFKMDDPADIKVEVNPAVPETATGILKALCSLAIEKGIIEDIAYEKDMFSTRLMGIVTPSPLQVRSHFWALCNEGKSEQATSEFYQMCRDCNYVKVDDIAQNIIYFADTDVGKLEITINLSKPEKDPKETAKLKNAPSVGYPKCMLCIENPGYAGRSNFPARQNHRVIPLELMGNPWYLQYSPYAYYHEHCIVFNKNHIPMKIDHGTFERLFSFIEQFPHYFLGSNADLPIVGGSILNHDHFQGGKYSFPMDKAGELFRLQSKDEQIQASVLAWPMTAISLKSRDKDAIINAADEMLKAWREWSDPEYDVYAYTDNVPHNTITPILKKEGDIWDLRLVLRNNRTSDEHPLGIFHPHANLHHIKKENIGLIEVMGLFILPGRLKTELAGLEDYLTGKKPLVCPDASDPLEKHYDWISDIVKQYGITDSTEKAEAILRKEVGNTCAQVLKDSGVYKMDAHGQQGLTRFLNSIGYTV